MNGYEAISGEIVATGNSETENGATRYDLIRIRTATGVRKLESVVVGATVNSFIHPGWRVTLFVKTDDAATSTSKARVQVAYAIATDEDEGDDITFLAKLRNSSLAMGLIMVIAGIPLCVVMVGFALIWYGIKTIGFGSKLPDAASMREHVAAARQTQAKTDRGEAPGQVPTGLGARLPQA